MNQTWKEEDVVQSLEIVLRDAKFAAAPQMSAFLKFVVMQTLQGKADRIKAYTVAVDALGKPPTFDPQNDPSVRVLAKRLRDTLTAYYDRTTGHKIILQLKSGSYIPKFLIGEEAGIKEDQSVQYANANGNVTPLTRTIARNDERRTPSSPMSEDQLNYTERTKVSGDTLESTFGASSKLIKH